MTMESAGILNLFPTRRAAFLALTVNAFERQGLSRAKEEADVHSTQAPLRLRRAGAGHLPAHDGVPSRQTPRGLRQEDKRAAGEGGNQRAQPRGSDSRRSDRRRQDAVQQRRSSVEPRLLLGGDDADRRAAQDRKSVV